jgi:hypothetical protein
LVELEAVACINRLVAEAAPRKDDANRRATRLHGADLARRRVRTQQASRLLQVERVPEVTRRMILWNVQQLEVGDIVFNLLPFGYNEAERGHDLGNRRDRLWNWMQ